MKFLLTCLECGSTDVQPFYEEIGNLKPVDAGLNCRDCGNLVTMPELEKEWLVSIGKLKEA